MHKAGLPGFKPDLKYRLITIWQAIVKYVIVAEVPARLHIILREAVPLKLLNDEELAAVLEHEARNLLLDGVHLRLLFESFTRKRGVVAIKQAISLGCELTHAAYQLVNGFPASMLQVLGDVAVWVLQVMGQHVRMQVRFLIKTLVTTLEAAKEGLLSCVNPQMRLQVEV